MIRSLSPYYIDTPLVSPNTGLTCTDYTLYVYVWAGDKLSPPSEPEYTITKINAIASDGTDAIDVGRLVADFIDFTPEPSNVTGYVNSPNNIWVKTNNTYTTGNAGDASTPQNNFTRILSRGYSYGNEGRNYETTPSGILIQGDEFNVARDGVFSYPVILDNVFSNTVTVISYPDNEINYSHTFSLSDISSQQVRYVWVELGETSTDTTVEISFNGVTATLYITEECKYTPVDVMFQNKDGAQQVMTFFKERIDSMNVENEMYESDRGQPIDGNHQFVRFNVNAKSKFSINSGFIEQENNENIKQLLLSERLWIYDDGNLTPIMITSKDVTYKLQNKERLINYNFNFEYAYNEINNI